MFQRIYNGNDCDGNRKINWNARLIPARLGSDHLSVSARLGPAHRPRLDSASLRPAHASSPRLGLAWHGFGRVWLRLAQLVAFALDPRPGLAANVVVLCGQNKSLAKARSCGDGKQEIYREEDIQRNAWADPGSARIWPVPLQLSSEQSDDPPRIGSAEPLGFARLGRLA